VESETEERRGCEIVRERERKKERGRRGREEMTTRPSEIIVFEDAVPLVPTVARVAAG